MHWEYVEQEYGLRMIDGKDVSIEGTTLLDLLQADVMSDFLDRYAHAIGASDVDVAATFFSGWLSGVCAAFHDRLLQTDHALELPLERMSVEIQEHRKQVKLGFILEGESGFWLRTYRLEHDRHRAYVAFYGQNIKPLIDMLSKVSGVSTGVFWGLIATRLYNVKDRLLEEGDDAFRDRVEADFNALATMNPKLFGRVRNPFRLKFKRAIYPGTPPKQLRVKASCCLYHKIEGADGPCFTCPRLSKPERDARGREIARRLASI